MTLLEEELRKLPDDRLRELVADCEIDDVREAARVMLNERTARAVGGEEFLRRTFPPHPNPFS